MPKIKIGKLLNESHMTKAFLTLCNHFHVPLVDVVTGQKNKTASYTWKGARYPYVVTLYRGMFTHKNRNPRYVLAHEFSHHLDCMRKVDQHKKVTLRHDKDFYLTLREVVNVLYHSPGEYPWHLEYTTIQRLWNNIR